jgi:hypothetical protein
VCGSPALSTIRWPTCYSAVSSTVSEIYFGDLFMDLRLGNRRMLLDRLPQRFANERKHIDLGIESLYFRVNPVVSVLGIALSVRCGL